MANDLLSANIRKSSLAILSHIFEENGPDSLAGMMASILQGSTDTTFYVITLYIIPV